MKKWIYILLYAFLILAFIILGENLISMADMASYNKIPYHVAIVSINIILGLLLGLGNIIDEKKKKGVWKIDIPRLLFFLLPSLILNLYFIALIFNISWINKLTSLNNIFNKTTIAPNVISIILGYSITSVFKKKNNLA